jgi:DNA-directed RNA polymerase specialized sigma24 family protein
LNRDPKIRDYISERVEGMSFEEIYAKYVDAVYRFLKFKLGDEHLVEDVLQETFLAVYQNLQKIAEVSSPKAWILAIARHKLVDHLRKKRLVEVELNEGIEVEPGPDCLFIHQLLSPLDETARTILYGLYVEELTCRELAEILGIPVGTVKSKAHAARSILQNKLKEESV